jgi:hypothetical protein
LLYSIRRAKSTCDLLEKWWILVNAKNRSLKQANSSTPQQNAGGDHVSQIGPLSANGYSRVVAFTNRVLAWPAKAPT